jgi:hypothetical protein
LLIPCRGGEVIPSDTFTIIKNLLRNLFRYISPSYPSPPTSSYDVLLFDFEFIRQANLTRMRKLSRSASVSELSIKVGEGQVDGVKITAEPSKGTAVYCNPNAGLWELQSPNPPGLPPLSSYLEVQRKGHAEGWVEFYLALGYSVAIFNYRGYGSSVFRKPNSGDGRMKRLWWFMVDWIGGGGLRPESLCDDGSAVALEMLSADSAVILHGESIGGMVAAAAAARIQESHPTSRGLLIVDRTVVNLEAVAQRMLGGWIAYAMRAFLIGWDSNVVSNYVKIKHGVDGWRKVIAQDPGDAIIHYPSGLFAGVVTGLEMGLIKEEAVDRGLGWIGVGETGEEAIREERIRRGTNDEGWIGKDAEGLSYPGVDVLGCRRVMKFATVMRGFGIRVTRTNRAFKEGKEMQMSQARVTGGLSDSESEGEDSDRECVEVELSEIGPISPRNAPTPTSPGAHHVKMNEFWHALCLLDGLAGIPLGSATKMGRESVCSWLSGVLQAGPQLIARRCMREGTGKVEDRHFSPTLLLGGRNKKGGIR